jgi:hypothetical protein
MALEEEQYDEESIEPVLVHCRRRYGMARSSDEPDDALGDPTEKGSACPFCGSDGSCVHLLAHIDLTFGEFLGGTFFDLQKEAIEVMDSAIKELLRAKKPRQVLQRIKPGRLSTLVWEVQEQIGDSLEEENLRTCYTSFLDYLDALMEPGIVEQTDDFEGGPSMSSTYKTYWVKNAGRVAKSMLRRIKEEAKSLRKLV